MLRLEKLAVAGREPVPEPEVVRLHRVEWRLGDDGIVQLASDYEAGLSGTELQAKYGLSKGSVLRVLHEVGVEVRRQPVGAEMIAEMIKLYETGLSIRQVGAQLGIPKTTVQNTLAKTDVVMRPAIRVPRSSVVPGASPDR